MGFAAKILADSLSPDGVRLTTMEVTFPRIVLAEFNTHRMLSRNSASSRAIPVEKRIASVHADPFIPAAFGKNQPGMQASTDLLDNEAWRALQAWKNACENALTFAAELARLGVHKQLANRLLEPFRWHTVIVSATEWSNFFALRCHKDAQPEIRTVAVMMRDALGSGNPISLHHGHWHTPLVDGAEELLARTAVERWKQISVGRCARVSVLTHDGRRDPDEDVALCGRMRSGGHMSPYEHVARPMTAMELARYRRIELTLDDGTIVSEPANSRTELLRVGDDWAGFLGREVVGGVVFPVAHRIVALRDTFFLGNFNGWVQYRKELPHEDDFSRIPSPGPPPSPTGSSTSRARSANARTSARTFS